MEMLVAIAIITIIAAVMLIDYNRFGSVEASMNTARDITAFFRQTQAFSIGRREVAPGADIFNRSYGIYIELSSPVQIFMFADANDDNIYNSGEQLPHSVQARGADIVEVCGDGDCAITKLVTVYQNGRLDAVLHDNGGALFTQGAIRVRTPKGDEEVIEINQNGSVFIQ